jgi:hypothetical protein
MKWQENSFSANFLQIYPEMLQKALFPSNFSTLFLDNFDFCMQTSSAQGDSNFKVKNSPKENHSPEMKKSSQT